MRTTRFESRPLPGLIARSLRAELVAAHAITPFSPADPRAVARRVADIAETLGVPTVLCRGSLDLGGVEVDHLWIDVNGRVVDAAYPVFLEEFVATLRRWVVAEEPVEALERVAAGADLEHRVLGVFPSPLRYLGAPVWSARTRGRG